MTTAQTCPVCTRTSELEKTLEVCGNCFDALSGNIRLTNTAEFEAVTMAEDFPQTRASTAEVESTGAVCSWCSKSSTAVKRVLSRGEAHICNECVFLCADILRMELGDDFG